MIFKGSVSWDFRPPFFSWFNPIWALDKQAKVFSNFDFAKIFKYKVISTLRAAHRWDQNIFLINQRFILQIFSFMMDVFNPKRISHNCLFKSKYICTSEKFDLVSAGCNLSPEIFSVVCTEIISAEIVSVVCTEIKSAVCCTPQRSLCDRISRRNLKPNLKIL